MGKIKILISIILAMVLLLVGCSYKEDKNQNATEPTYVGEFEPKSAHEVTTTLIKELKLKNMIELDIKDISVHYGFKKDYLDDYSVYASNSDGCADEIAVFKILNKNKRQDVIDESMKKIKLEEKSYKNLNKKEFEKFSANSVSLHGDYVIVIICSLHDTAFKLLNDFYVE